MMIYCYYLLHLHSRLPGVELLACVTLDWILRHRGFLFLMAFTCTKRNLDLGIAPSMRMLNKKSSKHDHFMNLQVLFGTHLASSRIETHTCSGSYIDAFYVIHHPQKQPEPSSFSSSWADRHQRRQQSHLPRPAPAPAWMGATVFS